MSTECYFSTCQHHSSHYDDSGPFCDEPKCLATAEQLVEFGLQRQEQLKALSGGAPVNVITAMTSVSDGGISKAAPVSYPASKVAEFFSKADFKEFVGGRRIGQAFYDFMGFSPEGHTTAENHALDAIYEADGNNAKALIESYADHTR